MTTLEKKVIVYNGNSVIGTFKSYFDARTSIIDDYKFFTCFVEKGTNKFWGKTKKIVNISSDWILDDETTNKTLDFMTKINNAQRNYLTWQLLENDLRKLKNLEQKPLECPRCLRSMWDNYSYTDEHDTYTGMKCHNCKYDYSISH